MDTKWFFADYAWLDGNSLVRNVLVCTANGTISAIQRNISRNDVPESAQRTGLLVPGFINAHCHLEYSWMAGRLSSHTSGFAEWIRAMIASRGENIPSAERKQAMHKAAQALKAGGCTTVFDCSTDGESEAILAEAGLRHVLFFECLGLTQERAEPLFQRAQTLMNAKPHDEKLCAGRGLAPHAPYSIGSWLKVQLAALPPFPGGPALACHLAESEDEMEYLESGTGAMADLFREIGFPPLETTSGDDSASGWTDRTGFAPSILHAIHGNRFSDKEFQQFPVPKAVVACPATNEWFGRPPIPMAKHIASGANMCLGTDSLASSNTLDMLEILRMTARESPTLSGGQLLNLATLNPGRAWPFEGRAGRIRLGCLADLTAIQPGKKDGPLLEMLTHPDSRVEWTSVG